MVSDGKESHRSTESGQCTLVDDRNDIVSGHMWLVKCIARDMVAVLPKHVDVEDLVSTGTVGLIKAVDEYDASKGASLETYARWRIRGAMLDELRRQDVLPYSTRSKLRQLDDAISSLERDLGRYPTDDEIGERTGFSLETISRLLQVATSLDLYSLEEIVEKGEADLSLSLIGAATSPQDPLGDLERDELQRVIKQGIRDLPQTERTVVSLYYYEGLRMKEIGGVLGVSESRVSQIHSRAVLLLRGKLKVHLRG
jgi:RNA polymerase sigma factor for flagellar operon FliA